MRNNQKCGAAQSETGLYQWTLEKAEVVYVPQ